MANNITYDSLKYDDQFLIDGGTRFLPAMGDKPALFEDNEESRKEVLDKILTAKRYYEGNIVDTYDLKSGIENANPDLIRGVKNVFDKIDSMPDFYEEGGAPAFDVIKDYFLAGITDPITAVGIVGGGATFGFSGGATLAARQAAKEGVKGYLKNKIKLATTRPVLSAAAAESVIAGAGGGYRSVKKQENDIALGRSTSIDQAEAIMSGIIEGPFSVALGGVTGVALGTTTKGASVMMETDLAKKAGSQWVKNNLLPKTANDAISNRLAERFKGESKDFIAAAQRMGAHLEKTINRHHKKDSNEAISQINDLFDGLIDPSEVKLHPKVLESALKSKQLIERAQNYIKSTPGIGEELLKKIDGNNDYARFVYEAFQVDKRKVPFKKFITKHPTVLQEVVDLISGDPEWFANMKLKDKSFARGISHSDFVGMGNKGKPVIKADKKIYDAAYKIAEHLYKPKKGGYSSIKSTIETRKEIPEVIQKIWGKNYSPGQRVMQSIDGIMNRAERIRLGTGLVNSLSDRGLAVVNPKLRSMDAVSPEGKPIKVLEDAKTAATRAINEAREANGVAPIQTSDVVRIMGTKNDDLIKLTEEIDLQPKSGYDNAWTTKDVQSRLNPIIEAFQGYRPLFEGKHWALEQIGRAAGRTQGVIKIGKTVLSPITIARNAIGASLAMVGSGNPVGWVRGFADAVKGLTGGEISDIQKSMRGLGVTGQSIDVGQILTRLGRDINENPGFIEKAGTFGLAAFPKVYKKFLGFYGGTDDFFKVLTYMNEYRREKAVWEGLSKSQRDLRFRNFKARAEGGQFSGPNSITIGNYLAEKAAWNTKNIMPVYSRVPAVTEHALVRSMPVIGNFSAYPSEMFRNVFNILKLGAEELEEGFALGNARLISNGATRLAAFPAVAAAPFVAANAIAEANGTTEKIEALRESVPPWDKHSALVITDQYEKEGRDIVEYVNLSYSDPYSPLVNVIAPLTTAIANREPFQESLSKAMWTGAKNFLAPYTDSSLTNTAASALVEGDMAKLYKTMQPGFVKMGLDTAKEMGALKSDKNILGLPLTPLDIEKALYPNSFGKKASEPKDLKELGTVLKKNGLNPGAMAVRTHDITTSLGFAGKQVAENYNTEYTNFNRGFKSLITNQNYPVTPSGDIFQNMLSSYKDLLELDFVKDQAFQNLFENVVTLTGDRRRALKIFKDPSIKTAMVSQEKMRSFFSEDPARLRFKPRNFFSKRKIKELRIAINQMDPNVRAERHATLMTFIREARLLEREYRFRNLLANPLEN